MLAIPKRLHSTGENALINIKLKEFWLLKPPKTDLPDALYDNVVPLLPANILYEPLIFLEYNESVNVKFDIDNNIYKSVLKLMVSG